MKSACLLCFALFVLALSACGSGGNPPGTSGGTPTPPVVSISPKATSIQLGTQLQFNATASDGGGVSYSIPTGGPIYGTVTAGGLYTAPALMPSPNVITVRATSLTDPNFSDDATVTLQSAPVFGNLPIKFEVHSRGNWQASLAPLTTGIPFPFGLHTNVNTLRVQTDPGAVNVPAQFRVTSRWPGGSIRWLQVDMIADLSGTLGIGRYQVNNGGSGSATGTNLSVADVAGSVTVNTGVLRFVVSKTGFRLFESVQIDRDNDGQVDDECLVTANMRGIVVHEGGTDFLSNTIAPTRVEVEETGPIRVTIVAEGVNRSGGGVNKLNYTVRITAYNNLPFVTVQYAFKNMTGHDVPAATAGDAALQLRQFETADSINLELPLSFTSAPSASIGGNPANHNALTMTTGQYIEQYQHYTGTYDANDPQNPQPPGTSGSSAPLTNAWPIQNDTQIVYDIDNSGSVTNHNTHAPGWIQMAAGNLRVTAAMQEYWQLHPKTLRGQADGVMGIGIWPDAAAPLQVFAGAMKTHSMLFSFDRAGSIDVAGALVRLNIINDPPRGVCDPRHYAASRVFGQIGWTDAQLSTTAGFRSGSVPFVSAYFTEVLTHMGDVLFDRTDGNGSATGHEYGMWNFGDGKHDDPVAGWENNHWGISKAAFQWFAMSGNLNLLYLAETTSRHFRDVDVLHSNIGMRFDYTEAGNPAVSGGKASQQGKTRYTPNNKQHDLGHYNNGDHHLDVFNGAFLADHYLLTGDRFSLDALREAFTYLRGTWKRFFDAGNGGVDSTLTCPVPWLSNALHIAIAYEQAYGEFDSAAATMRTYVLNAVLARQANVAPRDPNGVGFSDTSGDFTAWQVGHLLEALEYTRWLTNDAALDVNIRTAMDWMLGTNAGVYMGHDAVPLFGAFRETPTTTGDFGGPNLMIGAGYVGAWRESAVTNWRTAADNLLDLQTQNISGIADDEIRHRTFAQFFRAGPLLLGTLLN